jgi:hypothetical protein
MGQLLIVLFFMALFFFAPLKAAAIFTGSVMLASLVVQATTSTISHVNVSLTDAFKALVYSFFFTAIAIFTIFSFMIGAPREVFMNPASIMAAGLPLAILQYGAYILGFKIALGLTLLHSVIVAAASTVITSGSIWFIAKMASHAN